MIANFQGGNGGVDAARRVLELFTHCLYFLACAATTGPRAGLFKLGISSRLAARHHEHTKNWQKFDLSRSALVRASSPEEARFLEITLRRAFRGQEAEAKAKAAGRMLSSEDLIALGSSRRYPGRQGDGWTEFYTVEVQELMLELAERLLECRGVQETKARIQRGLTPADLALAGLAADGTPLPPPPGSQAEQRALAQVHEEQQKAREAARAAAIAGAALELALAYEEHLLWVNLDLWRRQVADSAWHIDSNETGWADLYFGRFGPPRAQPRMRRADEPPPTPVQIRFEQAYQRRMAAAVPDETGRSREGKQETCRLIDAVYSTCHTGHLHGGGVRAFGAFPHPFCADALVLRLTFEEHESVHPFFPRFEALAARVESRLPREQLKLC